MKSLLILGLVLSMPTFAQTMEQMELDCSKAVVGFLKEKGVITGGEDGLCISDLKTLPQINVGLGSNTFPLGNADKFNVSKKTQDNLQTLQQVLMGKDSKAEVKFTGYADGEQNNIVQFDSRFLAPDQKTFTKKDLKNKISDTRSLKTLLELLKDYPEDGPIPYDQSKPELKTAQSLIRNYYLANDRAKKVCETTMPEGTDCSKAPIDGYASPDLETHGNKQCGPRRRAFLTFDLAPSGMKKAKNNNGRFGPHFESPSPLEYQRDLQIAASTDMFAKLAAQTGGTDPDQYAKNLDLILPPECVKDKGVLENTRDNSKRLIKDVNESLKKVTDANFKTAVLKGDYKAIKKKLDALNEKEDAGKVLTQEEASQMKVLEIITAGVDRTAQRNYKVANPGDYQMTEDMDTVTRTQPDGTVETLKTVYIREHGQDMGVVLMYTASGERQLVKYDIYKYALRNWTSNPGKRIAETIPENQRIQQDSRKMNLIDKDYPHAARSNTPSTDAFNCYSVASAIEENMQENDESLVDASVLVGGEQAKLNVFLNSGAIAHLGGDNSKPQGWACTKCQSGVTLDDKGKLNYQPRDFDNRADASRSVYGQHNSNSLTVGSLKNLKVFNISREAFGDKCPDGKSVCDCVKEQGHLEDLLKHSSTQKMSLLGEEPTQKTGPYSKWEKNWTLPKPENHCIFTPPVPHTCQVDPKGRSRENKSNARQDIVACKILDNIKAKYNLAADIDVNKYKNVVLGASVCKKSLPTADENKDCGFTKPSTGSGGSAKGAKQ